MRFNPPADHVADVHHCAVRYGCCRFGPLSDWEWVDERRETRRELVQTLMVAQKDDVQYRFEASNWYLPT